MQYIQWHVVTLGLEKFNNQIAGEQFVGRLVLWSEKLLEDVSPQQGERKGSLSEALVFMYRRGHGAKDLQWNFP